MQKLPMLFNVLPNVLTVFVLTCGFNTCFKIQTAAGESPQPIVIIHGAWGGSHHWQKTAKLLREKRPGASIYRASLTGQGPRVHLASKDVNLETHIQDVVNLIKFEDLENVVLIAHSYGGIVASAVADRMGDRIARILYLDAHLLNDGECFFSGDEKRQTALTRRAHEDGDGYLIPVDWPNNFGDVPHPLATLTDPLKLTNSNAPSIPASYWLFTDGGKVEDDSRFKFYQRAKERGYTVQDFKWGHNPQRKTAGALAEALLEATAQ